MKRYYPTKCPDGLITDKCNLRCKYCFEEEKGTNIIDKERLKDYFEMGFSDSIFLFGGEPLMEIDMICELIDYIMSLDITQVKKDALLKKFRSIITNGTLIKNNVEKIKKYDLRMQISIDGPEATSIGRVFPNGESAFPKIMEGIQVCQDNQIDWSLHGVIYKETLSYISNLAIWMFETYKKYKGIDYALDAMKRNNFQIIFEQDYTDKDIDIVLNEFHKIAEYIYSRNDLSTKQKDMFFLLFFEKHGAVCGAGNSLLAFDSEFNMYPCHRLALNPGKENFSLGNALDLDSHKSINFHNSFQFLKKKKYMYSAIISINNFKGNNVRWIMWCPSTNLQTSGSIYYQNCKYNVMFAELQSFIHILTAIYYKGLYTKEDLKHGNSKQRNNC